MNALKETRPAQPGDAAEIARLVNELGYEGAMDDTAQRLSALLASGEHFVVVADGSVPGLLGWAVVERRALLESGPKAEITGLVVGATVRRAGVGRSLICAAEQWAASRDLATIRVRSNVSRPESHSFYRGLGYGEIKTQHVYEKGLEI